MSDELDGDIGISWRVIDTNTELPTGVAPVCPLPDVHGAMHGGSTWDAALYDECCATVGPQLECWTEANALEVQATLNRLGVELVDG